MRTAGHGGDTPDEQGYTAHDDGVTTALLDELRDALAPGIQLVRPLGAGAMGIVFLARDPLLKRLVAVKVMAPAVADAEMRARFIREAESSAAVSHPNVAGIHLVGELPESGLPYFVMQFIEGRTLAEDIAVGPIVVPRAKRLIGEVATALAAAHARGLVHRDVKQLLGLSLSGLAGGAIKIVGKVAHDPALIDEVERLRTMRIRFARTRPPVLGGVALAADPNDRTVVTLLKNIDAPAYYGDFMMQASLGYCLNPREVLLGLDPARKQLVHDIGVAWGDPRARELERLTTRWIDDVEHGSEPDPVAPPRKDLAPLPLMGLGRLRRRIEKCEALYAL